jgi:hypothetical protein
MWPYDEFLFGEQIKNIKFNHKTNKENAKECPGALIKLINIEILSQNVCI